MNTSIIKYVLTAVFILLLAFAAFGQKETLTNSDIVTMTRAGLSNELIVRKTKDSNGNYKTTVQDLIELKEAGVADEIITLILDKKDLSEANNSSSESKFTPSFSIDKTEAKTAAQYIVLDPKKAFEQAKTIAIEKSTLNPSRQALEKELLKRKDWQHLNLNIVRYKEGADLYIEIGFVPLSIITHRYVFRVYDNKSGTIIAAGETTSWGNLAENLARHISKKLNEVSVK